MWYHIAMITTKMLERDDRRVIIHFVSVDEGRQAQDGSG